MSDYTSFLNSVENNGLELSSPEWRPIDCAMNKEEPKQFTAPGGESAESRVVDSTGEDAQPCRILVVDDHRNVRMMLQVQLRLWGYHVVVEISAEAAMQRLEEEAFDLMITDIHMPGKDGLELAAWVKEHHPDMEVIVMTGEASIESAAAAIRLNAFDYLLKPFWDLGLVQTSVERAIEKQKLKAELKLRMEELRASRASFSSIVEKNANGILVLDASHTIRYSNPAALTEFGLDPTSIQRLLSAIKPGRTVEVQRKSLDSEQTGYAEIHTEESMWGEESAYLVTIRDITHRKQVEQKLLFGAFHDELTKLPNRALFMDRLSRRIGKLKRQTDSMFGVLFVDLDRFKYINDSLGHHTGDVFLVHVAERLVSLLRENDSIARLSGDEFVILLDDLHDISDAVQVAKRVLDEFKKPFELHNSQVYASASIGITTSLIGYEGAHDVLRDADTALYHAKASGKARYELFTHTMHAQAVNFLELETDLRLAFERKEFVLYYQPIIDLKQMKVFGFEALLRWNHPTKGLMMPATFIDVAEETGLIVPLGMWTLGEACRQLKEWEQTAEAASTLKMSVNVSYRQFLQFDLIEQVRSTLERTGLSPERLKIELTENVLIEHTEMVNQILGELKDLNIQIDIDDFGTGYSSLSYLHRFPIDTLKIDRSFVSHMQDDEKNLEIVRSIVGLARNLDMNVVAEGIEHLEELLQLCAIECDYGQGYYFSRPLHAEKALSFLKEPIKDSFL